LALAAGCSGKPNYGPTAKVSGRLTMDGKPLPAGQAVSFMQMEKGFLAYGMTDNDGKFTLNSWNAGKMPVGTYKVFVAPPPRVEVDMAQISPEDRFEHPELVEPPMPKSFPEKYRDAMTSGLEYAVKAGDANNFEIDLKSE
jgi:hypothetical protein